MRQFTKTTKNQGVMLQAISRADEMYRFLQAGETLEEIGARYGITRQRVSQIFQRYEMPVETFATDEEILSTNNPEIIAERYGIKVESVVARMKRLGVTFPRKPYTSKSPIWTKERVMEIYEEYQGSMTLTAVAAKHGIAQPNLSRLFKLHGLTTKNRRRPMGSLGRKP